MSERFQKRIRQQASKKISAKGEAPRSEFASFGIVGWSVALPTLLGIALGVWIDRSWPSPYSWTLILLSMGAAVGCLNAWRWVEENML